MDFRNISESDEVSGFPESARVARSRQAEETESRRCQLHQTGEEFLNSVDALEDAEVLATDALEEQTWRYAVGARSLRFTPDPHGAEGRWQWSSLVAFCGAAQHVRPAALTAFFIRQPASSVSSLSVFPFFLCQRARDQGAELPGKT